MTRILLSFACALALILIPLSYSPAWAQTTSPSTTSPSSTQQDRTDRNDANQNQTNPDLNQDQSNTPSTDANSSGMRQKPASSSESNPGAMPQDQNRTQDQNHTDSSSQTNRRSQSRTESQSTGSQTTDQEAAGNRKLPNTAGELPLLA